MREVRMELSQNRRCKFDRVAKNGGIFEFIYFYSLVPVP